MEPALKVSHVHFSYRDVLVLDDVSFSVSKGDFVGIIGANGTGKSTLIKLILNILPKQSGDIFIFGKDTAYKQRNLYANLGYVSQKANSFNSDFPVTAQEIVSLNLYSKIGLFKRIKKEDKEQALQALKRVHMEKFAHRKIGNLSGGQQQRVFIARALVGSPAILLLDEPTVGIDTDSVLSIMELLKELNNNGITIIMTSHDIPSILSYANKALVMDQHGKAQMAETKHLQNLSSRGFPLC